MNFHLTDSQKSKIYLAYMTLPKLERENIRRKTEKIIRHSDSIARVYIAKLIIMELRGIESKL